MTSGARREAGRDRPPAAALPAVLIAAVILLAPSRAEAIWNVRALGNYQSARYGQARAENAYVDLLARQAIVFGGTNTLNLGLRLRRDDDLGSERHILTGQVNGDLRAGILALYLRHRPAQRPSLNTPAEWRREDTVIGGSLLPDRLPELHYDQTRRGRDEPGSGATRTSGIDRRIRSVWSLSGLTFDYTYRKAENTTPADPASGLTRDLVRISADHTGGVDWTTSIRPDLSVNALWRASDGKVERTGSRDRRSRYQRAESGLTYQPWKPVFLTGSASWQDTRSRLAGEGWRNGRTLDLSGNLSVRPWRFLEFTGARSYQEQTSTEQSGSSVDYALALVRASGRALPELLVNAAASRTWTLSRAGATPPANQASFGVTGAVRPGLDLVYALSGQALEGVSDDLRYHVSQGAEIRVRPSGAFRFITSVQTQRLGGHVTLRHPDRTQVRFETLYTGESGGSASLAYSTQTLRNAASSTRYTLTSNASLPWRRVALAWNGQASRTAGALSEAGRSWGFASSVSLRTRLQRRMEVTTTFTRTLPALGSGSSIWQASIQQRLR